MHMKVKLHRAFVGVVSVTLLLALIPATAVQAEEIQSVTENILVQETTQISAPEAQVQAASASELWIGDFIGEPDPNAWYSGDQLINFQVKGSPSVEVTYSKDGGEPQTLYSGDIGYGLFTDGTGTYVITAKEKDGRQVTHTISLKIDSVNPTITLVGDITTSKSSNTVTITTSAGDSGSQKWKLGLRAASGQILLPLTRVAIK